jgi:hypothetical protein
MDGAEPRKHGESLIVKVHAPAMYEAFFDEYRAHYAFNIPGEFKKADGELKAEWRDALEDLNSAEPSAYWCEVAYQSMKLELQLSCRTFALNISVGGDAEKVYAQKGRTGGRGVEKAAGGFRGGKEAREHFKRLRGFLPA